MLSPQDILDRRKRRESERDARQKPQENDPLFEIAR